VADAVADAVEKVARAEGLARETIDETALYKLK
jgi:hypothetical protein